MYFRIVYAGHDVSDDNKNTNDTTTQPTDELVQMA
jgi:hypothetical protein